MTYIMSCVWLDYMVKYFQCKNCVGSSLKTKKCVASFLVPGDIYVVRKDYYTQKGLSQMHYKMRERQLSHSCLHRDRHSKQKKPLLEANIKDDKRAGPKTRFFRSYFV